MMPEKLNTNRRLTVVTANLRQYSFVKAITIVPSTYQRTISDVRDRFGHGTVPFKQYSFMLVRGVPPDIMGKRPKNC
jgi:hypothetical protein